MAALSKEDNEKLKELLKVEGYKLTPQRRAVLEAMLVSEGKHLSTEEIYDVVKQDCPEIGLATVYRTVQLLEKMGVLSRINFDDGCNRYELVHNHEDHHHHHLVCMNCGSVEEAQDDLLDPIERELEKKYNFKITNHNVKFFGYCSNCMDKENLK